MDSNPTKAQGVTATIPSVPTRGEYFGEKAGAKCCRLFPYFATTDPKQIHIPAKRITARMICIRPASLPPPIQTRANKTSAAITTMASPKYTS